MPKITIVVGLPGSGKSRFCDCQDGRPFHDCLRDEQSEEQLEGAIHRLLEGRDSVINDVQLCRTWKRRDLEAKIREAAPEAEIAWYFLANDPAQCALNVLGDFWVRGRRDVEGRLREIRDLSPIYEIPAGHAAHPVQAAFTLDDLDREARRAGRPGGE